MQIRSLSVALYDNAVYPGFHNMPLFLDSVMQRSCDSVTVCVCGGVHYNSSLGYHSLPVS